MKYFKVFLLLIITNFFAIISVHAAARAASEEGPGAGAPMKINNLHKLPIIFLDESKAPDKDYAAEIEKFRTAICERTRENKTFSIDLSSTYLVDEGVQNLVSLLSVETDSATGKRKPYELLRRLDLSDTRFTEDGLLALKDLITLPAIGYIKIVGSYAAALDSINSLIEDLKGVSDTTSVVYAKLIWLPAFYFMKRGEEPPIDALSIKVHKDFYKIVG